MFNQLNYGERYYNEDAVDFISSITKEPQKINDILEILCQVFNETRELIYDDFSEFITDLEQDGFVITGKTVKELYDKEVVFSYKNFNSNKSIVGQSETTNIVENSNISAINIEEDLCVENLFFEITRRCNEKCLHCYIPQHERNTGSYISLDNAKDVINQAKEIGVWELTITGGEPFLHPQINEILRYARQKDIIIAIASNLTLLKDTHIKTLKEVTPFYIQVSLYSLETEIHDKITGIKGSHKKTMDAIQKCYDEDIPLQVNCPIIEANKNDYQEVLDWARAKGMKANSEFEMAAQTDFERNNMRNALNDTNTKKIFKQILQLDKDRLIELTDIVKNPKKFNYNEKLHVCGGGISKLFISADRKVYPCPSWISMELGNLKHSTLKDIYFKGKKTFKVRDINLGKYIDKIETSLLPFVKFCPSHFANSNNGDFLIISQDTIENARMKQQAVNELMEKLS